MKNTILLLLLLGITFLGCSDKLDNTIVSSPVQNDKLLPPQLATSKLIDGEVGGELTLNTTYINSAGSEINVAATLRILEGSYSGTINIEMFANPENASIQFFPEITFDREVRLHLVYQGIDLESLGYLTTRHVDFVYFPDIGDVEIVVSTTSLVNISQNQISVQNAKLKHFSRYGWIR